MKFSGKGWSTFLILFSVFFLLTLSTGVRAYTVEELLGEYALKGDLSNKTKKESAGYVIVFTRADLDRMRIKTLGELINYIPFARYNETAAGLSDVNYIPYQVNTFNPIVVYINDREAITPFSGNGFQLLGQMDMGYIDHVEVYLGIPSYEIGFSTSETVIKLYTKKGYRENASVVGGAYSSYGTDEEYFSTGTQIKDCSYFIYFNHRNFKRKKYSRWNPRYGRRYTFSRNKDTLNFYGEVENNNLRFETQVVGGRLDNFIGNSWEMTTKKNKTYFTYLYGGLYYTSDSRDLKASIAYTSVFSNNTQESDSPLGIVPVAYPPFFYTYNYLKAKLRERLGDVKITKRVEYKSYTLLAGFRGRYKGFKFTQKKVNGGVNLPSVPYNREYVMSGYVENHLMINGKNMLVGSVELNKHFENGGVRNFSTYGGRVGYIFNDLHTTLKSFLFYGSFAPSPYVIYHQRAMNKQRVSPQKAVALSGELTYRFKKARLSFKAILIGLKKGIIFTGRNGYKNADGEGVIKGVSIRYTYTFDPFNKVTVNGWYYRFSYKERKRNVFGGFVSLFNRFGNFSLFNSFVYHSIAQSHRPSFNLSSTITYAPSNGLTVYLKGTNLLNRAITMDYLRVNPLTGQVSVLDKVPVFDRRIWIGLEYKF